MHRRCQSVRAIDSKDSVLWISLESCTQTQQPVLLPESSFIWLSSQTNHHQQVPVIQFPNYVQNKCQIKSKSTIKRKILMRLVKEGFQHYQSKVLSRAKRILCYKYSLLCYKNTVALSQTMKKKERVWWFLFQLLFYGKY